MRILLVNHLYPPEVVGGAEMSMHELAEGLVGDGVEVHVVTLTAGDKAGQEVVDGVKVWQVPAWNVYRPIPKPAKAPKLRRLLLRPVWHAIDSSNPVMARRFEEILLKVKPDVVHTCQLSGISTSVWRVADKHGIPVIHTLMDFYLMCPKTFMYREDNCGSICGVCSLFARPRIRDSGLVAAVSGCSRDVLDRHLNAGYFPNAATREFVLQAFETCPDCVAKYKGGTGAAPLKALRLGYLGRMVPVKGIEQMLASLPYDDPSDWTMSIAGRGELDYERELREQFPDERIKWLGWIDTDEFLHTIDLLVIPSLWYEPGPRVVIEAYRHGVPSIATNRGGSPEHIEEGITGFVYDPGDKDRLPQLLKRAVAGGLITEETRRQCLRRCADWPPSKSWQMYAETYRALAGQRDRTHAAAE